ncbi:hypothetical protein LQG66_26025 [Bradyrhizobium ontarionense]|uniref:Uncharacterized protein n=1 Tax=Bradyrhizobium ontarionense TaxID=2898149 RepID=A0ABY3R5U1_9BRAD|nr:hypothetical protein [Bradyrhizobium sp. A19]UFZ02709.1 hypothetical protein LQG66_26025 [Bradyrhizobium sp. A19]
MPRLIRLLARNALIGFAIAALAVASLVVFDVARIGSLIAHAERGWLVIGLLTFMLGLTFASAQMGFAIMLLPYDQEEPPSGARQMDCRGWNLRRRRAAVRLVVRQPRLDRVQHKRHF